MSELGKDNAISAALDEAAGRSQDGRGRYGRAFRLQAYEYLIRTIRREVPGLQVGLCLEERPVFQALNIQESIRKCNCVL